ncbi:hypothetical protein Gpo141_00001500 [Globisporangium polare]
MSIEIFFFVVAFAFCYVYCQKKQTKRMVGMLQEAHYQNTMMALQQHQLQTNDMDHQGIGVGQQQLQQSDRYSNYAGL